MDKYRLKITALDHFGRGISKINNKIIFVINALPNEVVDVEIINEKSKYYEGKVVNFVKKSKYRVNPICPYFLKCGGCDLLHMSYSKQLEFKEEKVKNIMKKYANLECVNSIVPSPLIYNYRNKASFKYNGKIGFSKKKTNEIININECFLLDNKINDLISTLNEMNIKNEICVKTGDSNMIIIDNNVIDNNYIKINLNQKSYFVSSNSFFQVNIKQAENMFNKISNYLNKEDNVLDLYCGVGSIGIYVSDYCNSVLGIEIVEDAIKDANLNKKLNNINNISFKCGNVGNILAKEKFKADVIILDPPRNGLDKITLNEVVKINAKKIIYVSCEPITLARDLNILKEKYNVIEITPFDMFPNTYHVECVTVLHRKTLEK